MTRLNGQTALDMHKLSVPAVEKNLICQLIIGGDTVRDLLILELTPDLFEDLYHAATIRACRKLHREGKQWNVSTLKGRLARFSPFNNSDDADAVVDYLRSVADGYEWLPDHRVRTYLDELRDAHQRRQAFATCYDTLRALTNGHSYAEAITPLHAQLDDSLRSTVSKGRSKAVATSNAEGIPQMKIDWLWNQRLPFGAIATMEADPEEGKTAIYCDVAARLTRGHAMPPSCDDSQRFDPAKVLILNDEDGKAVVLKPRLAAAGADLSMVEFIDGTRIDDDPDTERAVILPDDTPELEQLIRQHKARLLVIENPGAYFRQGLSEYVNQDVRLAIMPLARVAEATGCCVLLIRHFRKSDGSAKHRGAGSIAYTAIARSVLCCGPDPEDSKAKLVAVSKASWCVRPPTLKFRVDSYADSCRIAWLGESSVTADEVATPKPKRKKDDPDKPSGKEQQAIDLIVELTADGPVTVADAEAEAGEVGISARTLKRARSRLRRGVKGVIVDAEKDGFGDFGTWVLKRRIC
jgi:hypothetical protein